MLLINEVSVVSLQLSGLSNDRSYYLNLFEHMLFWLENMRILLTKKKEKRICYLLVVITLNINQNTW